MLVLAPRIKKNFDKTDEENGNGKKKIFGEREIVDSKNETDSLGKVLVAYNFESFSIFYGRLFLFHLPFFGGRKFLDERSLHY